jgi:hypothetical protein
LSPKHSPSPPMPCSSHTDSQNPVPIWLPLARLHVHNLARRSSLEAGSTLEKKGGRSEEIRLSGLTSFASKWASSGQTKPPPGGSLCAHREETPCGSLAREIGNSGGARAPIPNGRLKWFYPPTSRAVSVVQSALGLGGCGREISVLATCSLQFAKVGSAATLSQQEKNHSVDVQRGAFFPRGDVPSAGSSRWPIA